MNISVVIPVHNVEAWIGETLESVRLQTRQPDEIIIVDDASTDRTAEVIGKSGLPVHLLHAANGNAAATRNAGVAQAKGDWIAFLDGDDVWHADHLESAVRLLQDTRSAGVLSKFVRLETASGKQTLIQPLFPLPSSELDGAALTQALGQRGHGFPTSGMILNTKQFRAAGGFDVSQKRRHDVELFMRVTAGHMWSYNPEATWTYRAGRPGSLSNERAECSYFMLRALLLNEQRYRGMFSGLIRDHANRVLRSCHEIADAGLRRKAVAAAWPRSEVTRRILYGIKRCFPLARRIIRRPLPAAGSPQTHR